jgi:hypothetical protein
MPDVTIPRVPNPTEVIVPIAPTSIPAQPPRPPSQAPANSPPYSTPGWVPR